MWYLFTSCSLKIDYMFRLSSLGHRQVVSHNLGNYTIYDTVCELSLLFNDILFLSIKSYY